MKEILHTRKRLFARFWMTFFAVLFAQGLWGQYYDMSSGNYSQDFADIANWTNNYASGIGASNWRKATAATGSTPIDNANVFTTTTGGGVQKGTESLIILATGTNTAATDLLLNFSNRVAGTISVDWAKVTNTVNPSPKNSTLKIQYSVNGGTNFSDLTGYTSPVINNNNSTESGTISNVTLPSALDNQSQVVIRFHVTQVNNTGNGNRPKFQLDNVSVTSTPINATQVATPTVSFSGTPVATDTYLNSTYATLSTTTPNTTIHYTVNNGALQTYSAPFSITATSTIEAYATDDNNVLTDSNALTKTVTIVNSPANDLCSNAETLSPGAATNGTMLYATATSGLGEASTKKDVWYKYTTTLAGSHTIATSTSGGAASDFDIYVYTSSCPASGNAQFSAASSSSTLSESLTATLAAGTDYYIRVVDFGGNGTTFSINLTAPTPPTAPVITNSGTTLPNATVGTAIATFNVTATGSAPITYSSANLPAGLSLNASTGAITGTPTAAGNNISFSVTATNSVDSDTGNYTITIAQGTQTTTNNATYNLYSGAANTTLNATTNAGKTVNYVSNNTNVVEIQNGNEIHVVGTGSTTITASENGDANWLAYNATINVDVTTAIIYQKITSLTDLTDGDYVIVGNGTNAMNTTLTSSKLQATTVSPSNDQIVNPAANMVWTITTENGSTKTIYNAAADKYAVGTGNSSGSNATYLDLVGSVTSDLHKWNATVNSNDASGLFRFVNASHTARGLYYNGTEFGKYATNNIPSNSGTNYYPVSLYKKVVLTSTTWADNNGTLEWSNSTPNNTIDAIIDADYTGAAFEAKNLTVNSGKKLTVTDYVKAVDITNKGTIEVANGANFVQTGGFTAGTGSKFAVRVNTKLVKRLAYVAWSSPLATSTQTLQAFSYGKQADGTTNQSATGTLTNRFYNWANGTYVQISDPTTGTFIPGKGFQIRTPNDFTTTGQTFLGYFEGTVPNSGTVTFSDAALNQADDEYIFLGNPYPGFLDIAAFLTDNPDAGFTGDRTVYVWKSETSDVAGGNLYNTYKAGDVVPFGSITNGKIAAGQGFFVEKTTGKTSFEFNNNMRATGNNGTFLKVASVDRFWLEMKSSTNVASQVLMAFRPQATSGYDADWDAKMMGSSTDVIYTTVDNKNLVIDVHGNFVNTDKFNATVNTSAAGSYNISLAGKEGIFNNGQKIYIKDNVTGITGEVSQGAFNFLSNGGIEPNRFEISFVENSVLATQETGTKDVEIYGANNTVYAKADKKIKSVKVYDLSGRLIKSVEKANGNSVEIPVSAVKMVLASVELADGKIISQKIKF